jgi:hypothetical protein
MPKWRSEYRRCDNCRSEYRPKREAQSYCNCDCRRAAAYGRERFKAGTVGRRKRRSEASDKPPKNTHILSIFLNMSIRPETGPPPGSGAMHLINSQELWRWKARKSAKYGSADLGLGCS